MPEIRCAILTISDRSSRGERSDVSGPALHAQIDKLGWKVVFETILPDEIAQIENALTRLADTNQADIIFTTGGTGCAPRDVTPEATQHVIQQNIPGLAEAMRQKSLLINAHAMLSRGLAGIREKTIIINLPGSPTAAIENLEVIAAVLPHAVALLHSDPTAEAGHQIHP